MLKTGLFLGRIPYIRGGAGGKTAVVFFGANALFQPLDRARPRDYARMVEQVLPPGYVYYILGYDADPPPDYGFDHIVRDFADIVREQVGRTVIIGVSFGGFVAQRFAAEHPELVEKLVLLISAHRFSAAGWRKVLRQEAYMRRRDLYGFVKDMALLFRRPWFNWMLRLALWQGRRGLSVRLNDPDTMLRVYESLFSGFDNAPYVKRVRAPALVLGGTRDQFFDVEAFRETAALIPGARLHLFSRETHMVPLERSSDVRRVISEFLEHTDAADA
jgi:pimeloyl-ACP methyl ester carboxylesterase